MSTSVRFPPRIEQDLAAYCVSRSMTKSEVLIKAVTLYLSTGDANIQAKSSPDTILDASPIYKAFASSGLIGKTATGQSQHGSATKERVAEMARQKILNMRKLT